MQNLTGCKINVSPASGRDIEREIGLVGTRQAIESAKRAIMEKVDAVVSPMPSQCCESLLTLSRSNETALKVGTVVMMTDTAHNMQRNSKASQQSMGRMCQCKLNRRLLEGKIPMPPMVVIVTTWLCGTLLSLNSSNNSKAVPVKLTLQVACDRHDLTMTCPVTIAL